MTSWFERVPIRIFTKPRTTLIHRAFDDFHYPDHARMGIKWVPCCGWVHAQHYAWKHGAKVTCLVCIAYEPRDGVP